MQSIPLKKGEMVIWNTKNMINKMEITQCIGMHPSQQKYIKIDHYGNNKYNALIFYQN